MRLGWVVVAGACALAGCGDDDETAATTTSSSTTSAVSTTTTTMARPLPDLGDCFNTAAPEQFATAEVVPCDQPHLYEIFHELEMDGADGVPYPGDAAALAAAEACIGQPFTEFVGAPYDEVTTIDVIQLHPTAETWAQGERTISCIVTPVDGQLVTGTLSRQ
ncbi:MAG: septum formation family protein [Acidimicrobiales bacterium]